MCGGARAVLFQAVGWTLTQDRRQTPRRPRMEPVPEKAASASIAHSRMSELPFKFDEIGIWSELKLEIIEQYGAAYTTAFARTPKLKKYYIDAFSGAGQHVAKKTKMQVEGSPARALKLRPPFDGYYFINLEDKKTDFPRA